MSSFQPPTNANTNANANANASMQQQPDDSKGASDGGGGGGGGGDVMGDSSRRSAMGDSSRRSDTSGGSGSGGGGGIQKMDTSHTGSSSGGGGTTTTRDEQGRQVAAGASNDGAGTSAAAAAAAGTATNGGSHNGNLGNSPTNTSNIPTVPSKYGSTDQAVLDYLTKKGMGTAALELTDMLNEKLLAANVESAKVTITSNMEVDKETETEKEKTAGTEGSAAAAADDKAAIASTVELSPKERLEQEDAISRNQRTLLTKSTGGGYGYDRDATWQVVQWGIPDATAADATTSAVSTSTTGTAGIGTGTTATATTKTANPMGVDEARSYLEAFTSLQLWVLSLPDHEDSSGTGTGSIQPCVTVNPMQRARELLQQHQNGEDGKSAVSVQTVVKELVSHDRSGKGGANNSASASNTTTYHLPPSAKPELLSVTFALLVHTYCELLEVGMESTAHCIRDAFKPVYEPLYKAEFHDLMACATTEDMMRLNTYNSQHMEALNSLKQYLIQMAHFQLKREELHAQTVDVQQQAAKDQKIQDYDRNISILRQKYNELSKRVSAMFDKLNHLPFLRRARAVRWQLNMSTSTYGLLVSFLNSRDESLLSMSTLLQTKCELHVERRDPLPFTPACVLDDRTSSREKVTLELNKEDVNWAAPAPRRETESKDERLPFPKYHLEEEYDDTRQAARDKRSVEFNRALLVNGFRRLEALERKREYETMPAAMQKMAKEGYHHHASSNSTAIDPLKPTILLSTLCASTPGPILRPAPPAGTRSAFTDAATIWEEAGIGLCCAKVCPPDGRRVAVGCDDSAIRIWNLKDDKGSEPTEVLLGHKNGFPVFDVTWNRDGRSLLSAGGDGSIRLWDTMAVGPFGDVANPTSSKSSSKKHSDPSKKAKSTFTESSTSGSDMNVVGLRPENAPYSSGAALAVYRGHAPSSPVWSVAFAPSGYYFASAGGDATARLWTTDRPTPVRLFTGHSASNVNCVEWHPNCNYIITGSDDKTVRLWDIQTGQTVRLLNGCSAGINHVKISPGGRYAAGSDYSGVVHLWDLGNGKKITEFRTASAVQDNNQVGMGMVHSLVFSKCGNALASGGDDGTVRIWDVRQDSLLDKPVVKAPAKSFPTRGTILMDLSYTKRNLLLAMGKVATPVPSATHGTD